MVSSSPGYLARLNLITKVYGDEIMTQYRNWPWRAKSGKEADQWPERDEEMKKVKCGRTESQWHNDCRHTNQIPRWIDDG